MSRFGASHGCDWEPRLSPKRLTIRFYLTESPSRRCQPGGDGMFVAWQTRVFQSCLTAAVRGNRKLEAYATWGMLPACLSSHRERVRSGFKSPADRPRDAGRRSSHARFDFRRRQQRTISEQTTVTHRPLRASPQTPRSCLPADGLMLVRSCYAEIPKSKIH